jgi:DNA-binding transcriptional LysR family regulator
MPGVHVVLQMLAVSELEEALAAQRVDLGVALSPIMAPVQQTKEIGRIPCVVLLQREHPLSARSSVSLQDLSNTPEIGFGLGQDFGRSIAAAFSGAGLERSLEIEVGTTTTAMAQVRAGGGFAIVDAFSREYLPSDMVACRLEPELSRPLTLAHSPGSGTPALADRFEALLVELTRASIAAL